MTVRKIAFSFVINVCVSIIISIVVSIYMAPSFGGEVNVMTFTLVVPMCTAIGTIIGSVFATVVPVGPICTKIAHKLGAAPGSPWEILLRNMAIITMMLFVMNFAITLITHYVFGAPYSGDVAMAGDLNAFLNAWMKPIPALWGPCYVMSLIVDPLCMWIAVKLCGDPMAPPTSLDQG
jgi:hypothetical protein